MCKALAKSGKGSRQSQICYDSLATKAKKQRRKGPSLFFHINISKRLRLKSFDQFVLLLCLDPVCTASVQREHPWQQPEQPEHPPAA